MNQITIQTQLDAIRKVTEKAVQSKESALKFLQDAGLLKNDKTIHSTQKSR